ncbi:MAG: hypothetical protein HOJ31_10380 [Anaerolineae bacterium]|jgi:hypothetical protein|nr:hypothetical protein [Anaerolineae bacterium]
MRKKKEKKGAGKPAFFSKPMKRINVMLDEDTVKFYTEQGKGNLSEGIRQYWRGLTTACTGLAPTAAQDEQGSTGASQ